MSSNTFKPDKYSLNIIAIYLPTYYVRNLINRHIVTERNPGTDNWFASIPFTYSILIDFNLIIVGTIINNNKNIL